jgi:MFS family permease
VVQKPIVVVLVLTLASAMANAGASLLSACLPMIKAEFGFSDSQLGLLTGYASALTFALLAFPISAWAARWGNSRVLGACLIVYSAANALTAACGTFWQLLLARFASGLGPAAEGPLGQALVSDHYPPERRPGALAIYTLGFFGGITGGLVIGGHLAAQFGWRQAFIIFAIAGVVVAALQMALARDTVHAAQRDAMRPGTSPEPTSGLAGLRDLLRNRLYLHVTLGVGWSSFATFGLIQWMPSFYNRQFQLPPEQAAALFGGIYAAGALMGVLLGGAIGNRMGGSQTERLLAFCMLTFLLTFPLISVVLFAPSVEIAFAAHVLSTFVGSMPNGPLMAMIQNALPRERRVLGASMFLLTLTLLGAGGGPLLIGVLSDALASTMGQTSLRWAMLAAKLLGLMLFAHLGYAWWLARRSGAQAEPAAAAAGTP